MRDRKKDELHGGVEREEKREIALRGRGPVGRAAVRRTKSFQREEEGEIKESKGRERIRVRMSERERARKRECVCG